MRRLLMFSLAAIALVAVSATPAFAGNGKKAKSFKYKVTVENLSTTQPFSPPLAVIHNKKFRLFEPGTVATHGLAAIAEDANNEILEEALPKIKHVKSVATVATAPIGPGASAMFEVETMGSHNRLSLAFMAVNTNDGFSGLNSLKLRRTAKTRVIEKGLYDAGSEANNQLKTHIPGPCCGNPMVRAPEGDVIRKHPGIKDGTGDLTVMDYGWDGAVAKITIERVAA